jgi:hypothetical protein
VQALPFSFWRICETGRLPKFPVPWDAEDMNLRRLLNLVLAVFVAIGLAVAPSVPPSAAAQNRAGDMTDMSMADTSMSSDMPCCPDQKSMGCQDCPLTAMCVLQTEQAGPPAAAALLPRYAVRTAHSVGDDTLSAGLDRPPPDQPPRSQV